MLHLRDIVHELTGQEQIKSDGQVVATRGPVVLARIPHAAVGDICEISTSRNRVMARVVAFQ